MDRAGRLVGADRAAATEEGTSLPLPPVACPSRIVRCCAGSCTCCAPTSSGNTPQGTRLRLGHDLLAPAMGLELGRRLATPPRAPAGRVERRRATRLVPLCGRLFPRQRPERGLHTRPSTDDWGRAGSKHHLITDGHGTPLAVVFSGGDRSDTHRCHYWTSSRPSAAGSATPAQAGLALRRPRLRSRHLPRPGSSLRRCARCRPPKHPPRQRPWRLPMGGGADLRLAPRLPTTPRPLGTTSRHPRGLPQTGLLSHHPPTTQGVTDVVAVMSSR